MFDNKPKLVDKLYLKKIAKYNKKQKYLNWSFVKNITFTNVIGLLLVLGVLVFLYYRYIWVNNKKTVIKHLEPRFEPPINKTQYQNPEYYGRNIVNQQTEYQTRFIPENRQYSDPVYRQQPRYVEPPRNINMNINQYQEQEESDNHYQYNNIEYNSNYVPFEPL